jgi:hypothetical protein
MKDQRKEGAIEPLLVFQLVFQLVFYWHFLKVRRMKVGFMYK